MANLAVFVELAGDGHPTLATCFALGEARRISQALGATVYAWVFAPVLDGDALDLLATELGRHGADRALACASSDFGPLPDYATYERALGAMMRKLWPRLVMFPAGGAATEVGAAFASAHRAVFFADAHVEVQQASDVGATVGQLSLVRVSGSGKPSETLNVLDTDHAVVCTLIPGPPGFAGGREAECEVLSLPAAPRTRS